LPDYSPADFKAIDQGSEFSLPRLLPETAATDFSHVGRLGVPVEIFAGRYDYTTPTEPVTKWLAGLHASAKRIVRFENSAHVMYGEEPGRVLIHLVEDVRPYAVRAGDAAPDS
jgi:pimeloyl-ACP methyl ester carboxylesterase